ncbi:MAG: hypothetical protein H7039_05380 [Bryobacteraceae bacterium]|nr:hypothetical protein [Bryobacteraceae bacterium]
MDILDALHDLPSLPKDAETVLRGVARGVIRRVIAECKGCRGMELEFRLSIANPFAGEEAVSAIWEAEVLRAEQLQTAILN